MPASRRQEPPKAEAAKRKGGPVRAKSTGATQRIGTRAKARAKPDVKPAPRIAGIKQRKQAGLSLYEISESKELPAISAAERKKLLAWRKRVERLAETDPEAYLEACRSGKQL